MHTWPDAMRVQQPAWKRSCARLPIELLLLQLFGLLVFEVTINSKRSTGGRTLVVEYVWVGTTIMIGILQWSSNACLCVLPCSALQTQTVFGFASRCYCWAKWDLRIDVSLTMQISGIHHGCIIYTRSYVLLVSIFSVNKKLQTHLLI